MPIMNRLTAAYLAGIIDGEGSIDIQKSKKDSCITGYHYSPRLRIGMIDEKFITWLKNSFGGYVFKRTGYGNNSDSWTWQVSGKIMKEIIIKIYPYLRIKKEHAEIIMKFWKTKEYKPIYCNGHGHKELTSEMREKRNNLFERLKTLQIKGKNAAAEETERENPTGMRQSELIGKETIRSEQ